MLRIGIVGFGFMGRMHHRCWLGADGATVAAICEANPEVVQRATQPAGNIDGASETIDLTGVAVYEDFATMLREASLDAVSITAPSFLHAQLSIQALEAGVHVLCEKPMALTVEECDAMIAAADSADRTLMIGHCIRFWPEYAKAKEIVASGEYGAVRSATFRRLGAAPGWTAWFLDGDKSGGVALDLHVHDADYIHYLLGMPKAVRADAARFDSGMIGHISATYDYGDGSVVTAEGSWMLPPSFGFEMTFHIILERAAIVLSPAAESAFRVCTVDGDAYTPDVPEGDGYTHEISLFARVLQGQEAPTIAPPQQSRDTMRLVLAEKESADSGQPVTL